VANEVEIVVIAHDRTAAGFAKARENAQKAGKNIEADLDKSVGGAFDKIGKDAADAGDKIGAEGAIAGEKFGDGLIKSVAKVTSTLGPEGSKAGREFSEGFAREGEVGGEQFVAGFNRGTAKVGNMETFAAGLKRINNFSILGEKHGESYAISIAKGVANAGGNVAQAGIKIGSVLGQGIIDAATILINKGEIGTAIIGILITTLALIAPIVGPAIGAAIGGLIVGAAGAGGIIGGIFLVKDNPAVKAAAKDAGDSILKGLQLAAAPIVEPLVQGLGIIKAGFAAAGNDFKTIFSQSASWIAPLSNSVSIFLQRTSDGLAKMFVGADPVMRALGTSIEFIGVSLQKLFTDLGTVGPQLALGLQVAFTVIGLIIQAISNAITNLSKAFGFLAEKGLLGPEIKRQYEELKTGLDATTISATGTAKSFDGIKNSAAGAATATKTLSEELKKQADPMFALITAQQGLSKAQTDAANATKKYGANSKEARDASVALAKAAIEMQIAVEKAAGTFDGKLTPSMRALLKAAGATDAEIANVEKAFNQANAAGNKFAKAYKASIQFQGAGAAVGQANAVTAAIGRIPATKVVTIKTSVIGGYVGYASGGVVRTPPGGSAAVGGNRNGLTLVGEQGPELVRMAPGSQVIPAGRTQSMLMEKSAPRSAGGGSAEDDRMWERVLDELRANRRSMESMTVMMDGVAVGRVQGRTADLYTRAG
jgi:hypothetical protein